MRSRVFALVILFGCHIVGCGGGTTSTESLKPGTEKKQPEKLKKAAPAD